MRALEFQKYLCRTLDRRHGTAADYCADLQADGLFAKGTRGRNGGIDLTETDVINGMLALALDHPRGENPAATVRRVRGLFHGSAPTALPYDFAKGLSCFASVTAGDMLDNILRDLRTGRFETWAAGEKYDFAVSMFANGSSVFVSLAKEKRVESDIRTAIQGYEKPGFMKREKFVERQVSFGDRWFREIAEMMGPLPAPS